MAENTADFVAGWASGAVATLATQPVDLVITRLQAGTARSISGAISAEPITALWRGMGPLLAVQPISNALMFVGYGAGKSYAERNQLTGGSALLPVFFGGCAGGCAQSLAQSPAELLKVRRLPDVWPAASNIRTGCLDVWPAASDVHTWLPGSPELGRSRRLSRCLLQTAIRWLLISDGHQTAVHLRRPSDGYTSADGRVAARPRSHQIPPEPPAARLG